jgi:hypothetical protein
MPTSNDGDNHQMFTRLRNSEVSRNFHRLGLLVAAIILTAGLLLMVKDALGLRLWDLIPSDIPILAGGIAIGLTQHRISFIGRIRHHPCDRLGDRQVYLRS